MGRRFLIEEVEEDSGTDWGGLFIVISVIVLACLYFAK